jgi:hypothetical protein
MEQELHEVILPSLQKICEAKLQNVAGTKGSLVFVIPLN